ncbi:hypothetical protein ABIF38_006430 [Bradyrhizobium japonicum]|uniref:hypothetical protein n=1 Tax=Bradyrhizobium elkanii TaxID=29448 RepID=UPI000379ED58|nr:hypothetical protein [Bradyrhizobium elkanii]WAX24361.1 hypothetical protein [Bradyrhizobium phage ppBeUSDA76-1]MCP1731262.1 hypothetical protein [Bradyrhizobium elkanii]MCS3575391.1 hypothetical protein [Bradyrhizobium elkanii]MCS3591918.1 hypothetical protein [Bradyrhizobium elkanii]MCS3621363.1 hypothetical protein [Bradyrhizobium elkanii]
MAQQVVNVGAVANDGTGDALRTAFQKLNANDTELYSITGSHTATLATYGTAATKNVGTAAGNVPVLDGSGLLDTAVLPALAITDVFTVASQAAMLALAAQKGDIAIRSDLNKSFALSTNSPATLADWKELLTPTDAVLAVAGLTGSISAAALKTALALVKGDVGLGNVDNVSVAAAPTDYTPSLTSDTGDFTTATATGTYKKHPDGYFDLHAEITITNKGAADGTVKVGLPAGITPAARVSGFGVDFGTGTILRVTGGIGAGTVNIVNFDLTSAARNNVNPLVIDIRFKAS